ncbi:MAG TPA: DUF5916 domain-containing protein, partial [Gemmatimonadota bacterium]|nr:DUF5916 domain-containing protein [Gemmatimonadota bacterium]
DDGNEDVTWDAVWDAATRVDSSGWTAEFRIPLSQLRYDTKGRRTFGLLIERFVERYTETDTWPLLRPSRSGLVSQFGELTGLEGLGSPGHGEVTPYVVTRNVQTTPAAGLGRTQEVTLGGDLEYRIASNIRLAATVNPDFGQVEADPSVLNLGAFETFYSERRPFFVEGKGLFRFPVNCVVVVDCNSGEGLFYSRRIGRSPQLAEMDGRGPGPVSTPILGAVKVTGRRTGGFTLGFLDAVTGRVTDPAGSILEPTTNYAVARGSQDFDRGDGNAGFILTAVDRRVGPGSAPYLHSSAYAGGVDARRRFAGRFEVSGSLDLSRVAGSPEAIARTQRSTVHLYQRPDGPLVYDSTRTSLSGSHLELRFAKVGGERLHFETAYQRRTPGFDINDVGFLEQADRQAWTTWAQLAFRTPNAVFQRLSWNFNNWEYWSLAGLPTERAVNTNVHTQLNNRWWIHLGGTLGQLGTTWCDRCARGGPAVRQDPYLAPWGGISGDERHALVPYLWVNYFRGDGGRSSRIGLSPELSYKVSTRFTTSLSADWTRNHDDAQYFDTFVDSGGTAHYAFAHLEQRTLGLTWRLDYTFTPEATLQVYASPFVSRGTYSDLRELARPGASDYADRLRPYADPSLPDGPGGFDVQEFRSNVVFRWEYRPGSTLFLVWSQGREGSAPLQGGRSLLGDVGNLFGRAADNTFLVKLSYRLAG